MSTSIVDRYWAKVVMGATPDDCWSWSAWTNDCGYGQIRIGPKGSRRLSAHRFSAMLHFGMFDRRMWVLHTCDNPQCTNPRHLYLGDQSDNERDKVERGRHFFKSKTHCIRGHEFTEANTYIRPGGGHRACRTCQRESNRRVAARKRAR